MSVEGGKMHKGISKPGVVTTSFLAFLWLGILRLKLTMTKDYH